MARRKTAGTRSRYGRGGAGRGRTGGSQRGGGRGMSARGYGGAHVGGRGMAGGVGGGYGGAPAFSGLSSAAEGRLHAPSFTIAPQFLPPGMSLEQSQQFDPYGVFGQGAGGGIPVPGMVGQMPGMTSGGGGFTASPLARSTLASTSYPSGSFTQQLGGGGGGYQAPSGGGGGGYTQTRPMGGAGEASLSGGSGSYQLSHPEQLNQDVVRQMNQHVANTGNLPGTQFFGPGGTTIAGAPYEANRPGGGTPSYSPNYSGGGGPVLGGGTPKGGVYLPGLTPHSGDIGSAFSGVNNEVNKPGGGAPHFNPNYGGGNPNWRQEREWQPHQYGSWANNPNNPNYGQQYPGVGLQNNINANPQYGQPGGGAPHYNPNYGNQQNQQNQQNQNKKVLGPYAGKGGM